MKRSAKLDGVGNVVLEEVEIPQPGEREVLIRLKSSLISRGSEILARYNKPTAVDPAAMGYSAAGVVVELGSGVSEYAVGDRVSVVAPHAEYVVGQLDAGGAKYSMVPLPDEVGFEEATFIPLTTSSCAWTDSAMIKEGDTVVVLGQGLVGSIMLQVIKHQHDVKVIVVDGLDLRCQFAEQFGADDVIDCSVEDPVEKVRELTDGRMANVVIDCVGGAPGVKSFAQAQEISASGGIIVLIGLYHGDPLPLDASKIMGKLIVGGIRSDRPRSEHRQDAVHDIQEGRVRAKEMITHRFSFAEAKTAFDLLADRLGETLGVVFEYE